MTLSRHTSRRRTVRCVRVVLALPWLLTWVVGRQRYQRPS